MNAHECIKYIKEKRKRGVFEGGEGKEICIFNTSKKREMVNVVNTSTVIFVAFF